VRSANSFLDLNYWSMKMNESKYTEQDLSCEEYREIVTRDGVYRIDAPVKLIRRDGGSTHRVVDATGVVHCYVAPESGLSVTRWKAKDPTKPVSF